MAEAVIRDDTAQDLPTNRARRARRQYAAPPFLPIWALIGGAAVIVLIGAYPYYGSSAYVLSLLGKFLCFAIFALSIDLIWGFAGILSLGQAVYFGIGAYVVALSLKLNYALDHPTRYGGKIPDFMEWNSLTAVPDWMMPLYSYSVAITIALIFPTIFAFLFGVITFKRHIYGVYCAVITLAEFSSSRSSSSSIRVIPVASMALLITRTTRHRGSSGSFCSWSWCFSSWLGH